MKENKERSKENKESNDRKNTATAAVVSAGAGVRAYVCELDIASFVNLFNGEMVENSANIPYISTLSTGYARMLHSLQRSYGQDSVEKMVHKAAVSDFLNNRGRKPFLASAEWLLREENFIKVLNGNYDNAAETWRPRDYEAERRTRQEERARMAREADRQESERRMRQREEWAQGAVTYEEYQWMLAAGEICFDER